MNKDTVVASVIGFGLGLIAAIALWIVPHVLPKSTASSSPKPQEVATNVKGDTTSELTDLDITTFKDGDIVKTKDLTIEGHALDAKLVVITSPDMETVITPTNQTFKTSFTLSPGANQIVFTGLTGSKEETKTLTVYFYEDPV